MRRVWRVLALAWRINTANITFHAAGASYSAIVYSNLHHDWCWLVVPRDGDAIIRSPAWFNTEVAAMLSCEQALEANKMT
jgi:hypothetical protein